MFKSSLGSAECSLVRVDNFGIDCQFFPCLPRLTSFLESKALTFVSANVIHFLRKEVGVIHLPQHLLSVHMGRVLTALLSHSRFVS